MKNPKLEARNPKQAQMFKIQNVQTKEFRISDYVENNSITPSPLEGDGEGDYQIKRLKKGSEIMGSVVKKRRKKMRKHKHKKQLDRDRHKKKK